MEKNLLMTLESLFIKIPDIRNRSGLRHELSSVLFMVTCSMFCGYFKRREMARFMESHKGLFSDILPLKHGVPGHVQLGTILNGVDLDHLTTFFIDWNAALSLKYSEQLGGLAQFKDLLEKEPLLDTYSYDGKTINSTVESYDNSAQNCVAIVSCLSHKLGLVVNSDTYEGKKEGEQAVVVRLLEELSDSNILIMLDALHCQKND